MSLTNLNSLLPLSQYPILSTPKLSPFSLSCQAVDIPTAGPPSLAGMEFSTPIEPTTTTNDSNRRSSSNTRVNTKDRRWSRDEEVVVAMGFQRQHDRYSLRPSCSYSCSWFCTYIRQRNGFGDRNEKKF